MTTWHLYILQCHDGSLYTGISTDIDRRLAAHTTDRGARRLRGRGPLKLLFSAEIGDRSRAQRMEYRVKRLSRLSKLDLIAGGIELDTLLAPE